LQRFKDEIKPMDKASETILALKPVTFRYKKEIDPDRTPEFGLVAEDVEKIDPDLVVARRRRQGLQRSLRGSERDAAERVPQSASTNRRTRHANRRINGAAERASGTDSKGERQSGTEQICAAISLQPS
jgi:Chaperone of endosialidase